eukprot:TRINITY_DN7757_c0_g1_i1.p3 TRINITY_DN7757_c0_g1~~TRINITY_DN7757_c0_g1_i1.p3  ORF type:complete len:222 (+),score=57.16 TRINITY_DN7757_c0_g1_i1:130-795(+)
MGAGKSIGDLQAIQGFINHTNEAADHDFRDAVVALKDAKAARGELEATAKGLRDNMAAACKTYSNERTELLVGKEGQAPLSEKILSAQGHAANLVQLGRPVQGCVNTCHPPGEEGAAGVCDGSPCRNTLEGMHKLEQVMSGMDWVRRDELARKYCASPYDDHKLTMNPPLGWGDVEEAACPSDPRTAAAQAAAESRRTEEAGRDRGRRRRPLTESPAHAFL